MTFEEFVEKYNKKAPYKFKRDDRYELLFDEDKGFCEVGETEDMLVIHQLSGDGRWWRDVVTKAAIKSGKKACGTWCVRKNIKAYIRLFGWNVYKTETTSDGDIRYFGERNGKHGIASPAGDSIYFITWEV